MKTPNNIFKPLNRAIVLIMIMICLTQLTHAQRNYLFENISVPEGLSNSNVNNVFQDSHGFLWISTADGLNRYDGNHIKVFKNDPNDSTTISTNDCYTIIEDLDGYLWIGLSNNSIAKYNPENETFQGYRLETRGVTNLSAFYSALLDLKGNLWFGTTYHGVQKFNKSKDRFEQVSLDASNKYAQWGNIFGMTELKNGNILAADYSSGIKIYNERLNQFQPYYLKANFTPPAIQTIYEDISGNIWFGGRNKLIKFSPSYYTTEEYDPFSLIKNPLPFDNVTRIVQDQEGYLWVGIYSQGLFRIDINKKSIQKIDYGSANSDITARIIINSIIKDRYGVVWVATWGNGLTKFDPLRAPFNFHKFIIKDAAISNSNHSTVIAGSHQSNVITIGTSEKGLFTFNLENYTSSQLKFKSNRKNDSDEKINIQGIAIDNEGNKWFAYNNLGLHKIDKNNLLSSITSPHAKKTSSYFINSIKIDLSGTVWAASMHGFEKLNPSDNQLTLLPTIMNKKMSEVLRQKISKISRENTTIASIVKVGEASNLEKEFSLDRDQKILIIGAGEGEMNSGGIGLSDAGSLLNEKGETIWSMNDLFKTFNNGGGFKNRIALGCLSLKKGNYKITYATDVGHSYGNWNVIPPSDSLWYGIQVLGLDDADYTNINQMNEKEISSDKFLPMSVGTSIEFSRKYYNTLWLGSSQSGFFKYDLSTGTYKQFNYDNKNVNSLNNYINCIFEDSKGIVWIATANSLLRFDSATENIERFDQKDGLPSNQINSILEDPDGNLWIQTSSGLSKLNKNASKDKWNFVNFNAQDGLQGFTSSKANWTGKNGELFFGGIDGFTYFYPGKINEVKPDIVIKDIKVSDISLTSDSAVVTPGKNIMQLDELFLSHTQNNLSFEFASIHFSRPGKNKILYMLEGFDNHWIAADRNYASYTNLNSGEYVFRVKGSNGDGIWNEEGKSIRIFISPPWWKTTFAYFGYFFLFAGVVFSIDRVQRRRILAKERHTAAIKVANLRAQLAEAENERKTKELEEARQLQYSMLPKELPTLPHLDIAVYMKTATEVGGDYYDFNVHPDGTLTVILGDATGHGMMSGMMVSIMKSLFMSARSNKELKLFFENSSTSIKDMQLGRLMMALTCVQIKADRIVTTNAGMPPLYIYRNTLQSVEEVVINNMPLGAIKGMSYDETELKVNKGDALLLMSDGFAELKNHSQELYGYMRAKQCFENIGKNEPEEIVAHLNEEGRRWTGGADPDDDVTFVVIKVK